MKLMSRSAIKFKLFYCLIISQIFIQYIYSQKNQENKEKNDAPDIEIIRADEAEYLTYGESKEGIMILTGGIVVRIGKITMQAETVKYNPKTGEIFGEGNVVIHDKLQKTTGEKFIYDNNTGEGLIYGAESFLKPIYLIGESIKRVSDDAFVLSMGYLTSCEIENPHYYFKAKKIWIYKNKRIAAFHLIYYVGNTPVFYWPFISQADIGTGIVTQYGYNESRGHFTQNTYYFGFSKDSLFLPENAKFMADWYQKSGYLFGLWMNKKHNFLRYNIDLQIANYKHSRIDTQYNNEDRPIITNQVDLGDGKFGEKNEIWWKFTTDLKAVKERSIKNDSQSSVYFKYENYKNENFDQIFGVRFEPENTIEMFKFETEKDFDGNRKKNTLTWQAEYTEDWRDNHFKIKASNTKRWYESEDSKYLSINTLAPVISFKRNSQLIKPYGSMFGGVYNKLNLNTQTVVYYRDGEELKTMYDSEGVVDFSIILSPFRWLSLMPYAGYGIKHKFWKQSSDILEEESDRASYQYFYNKEILRLGYPSFYLQGEYIYKRGVKQKYLDPTFKKQLEHTIKPALKFDFYPVLFLELSSMRDIRKYPYEIKENFRWKPFKARLELNYDFVNSVSFFYPELLEKKKYHFLDLGITNEYKYLIRYDKSGTNEFDIFMKMGGYKPIFIKELNLLKLGFTWRHNFINVRQDLILFKWEIDLNLHTYWRLKMGTNSMAEEVERYNKSHDNYVPFWQDIPNSFNFLNNEKRSNTVFNMDNFYFILEHDLHRWLLRLSYVNGRKTVYFGDNLKNYSTFYEQTFYISMGLKDFKGFGIEDTEIHRKRPKTNLY
ncbi:MAG: hypothetical protein OEZ13_05245 [Spirochaetia bacterium]|nr:hypothetical protein [Spirochaetia bacterium]